MQKQILLITNQMSPSKRIFSLETVDLQKTKNKI